MLKNTKGYTLIELAVVIVLIGIIMTLAIPKLRTVSVTDGLKSSVRVMTGRIMALRDDSIRDNKAHRLNFDLDSHEYWIDYPSMSEEEKAGARQESWALAEDVYIEDITLRDEGKIMSGNAGILFTKKGYIQASIIHLRSKDGRRFSLELSPFLGKVKVFDKYVDYDDL